MSEQKEILDQENVKVRKTGTSYAMTIPKRKSLQDYFKRFRDADKLLVSVVRQDGELMLLVAIQKEEVSQ